MRYKGIYIVRWSDKGVDKTKSYDDYQTAFRAKKWLVEKGVEVVDIAVNKGDK